MATKDFRCRLITPAAQLVDDRLVYASIPAWDGLMGVMPSRAPIVAKLGVGELRLDFADPSKGVEGGSRSFLIDGGFVQMNKNELTILADFAQPAESIQLSQAQQEVAQSASKPVAQQERAKVALRLAQKAKAGL